MENVVAVELPKGGTGKTTTSVNLAGALAAKGLKVLLVDNDWQGSASVHSGIKEPDEIPNTLADVLAGRSPIEAAIRQVDKYYLLPGNGELANVDVELMAQGEAGIYRLRDVLRPIADHFDVILIDCEPGMHIRSLGALAAADYLLAPVSADYLSIKPLKLFLRVIQAAEKRYTQMPRHQVGVVVTRFDGRMNQCIEVVDLVKKLAPAAGLTYFDTVIPERAAHRRAAAAGETVIGMGGADLESVYDQLAEQVMAW
jgi:chromosome partitioning protein